MYVIKYEFQIDKLLSRFWDLLDIFKYYYKHPDFAHNNSIKNVLPALIPNKSYEDLDLQKGDEAGVLWEKMINGTSEIKKQQLKKSLRDYCELDTLAMYEIFKHLAKL